LAEKGLIDEFMIMIHPVAIGNGTPFLKDINKNTGPGIDKNQSL
jgi:riboflavin biosynthesis pyrimidine reductase